MKSSARANSGTVCDQSRMWMPLRAPKMCRLHPRIPAVGLVAEVGASLDQLLHGDENRAAIGLSFRFNLWEAGTVRIEPAGTGMSVLPMWICLRVTKRRYPAPRPQARGP